MIRTASEAEISSKDLTSAGLRVRFQLDESNAQYHSDHFNFETPIRKHRGPQDAATFASKPSMAQSDLAYQDIEKSKSLYKWYGLLLSMLIKRRDYYSGDLDQFIIHMVLVLGEIRALNMAADATARNASRPPTDTGVNVQSLSDITRIPRESVRRKLTMLIESGLVRRSPDRLLYPGPASDLNRFFEDLSPLVREGSRPG
jgi:hypothetical protein